MAILKQSTAYTRLFVMVLTSDHITGATGTSPIVALSKAGAILTTAAGTVAEVTGGLGWYKVSLTTADTSAVGDLAFHITATSCDPTDFVDQVSTQILGDVLTVNTTQLGGQTVTATAGVSFASGFVASTGGSITTITGNVNGSVGSVTAGVTLATGSTVAITSNIKQNSTAAGFMFVMTDSTNHAPKTGLTVTATRSIDGAAFGACANAVGEVGNGTYTIDLAAADTNGRHIMLRFTAAAADDLNIEIITQP